MAEEHAVEKPGGHDSIHLPPPSYWPPVLALGIALLLTGLVINKVLLIVGVLISVVAIAFWVRGSRRELRNLPE